MQPNSSPYLDSVDEGTSSELEIHPKPNAGSRPNPSAGGFHPSVLKFGPLFGLGGAFNSATQFVIPSNLKLRLTLATSEFN